MSAEPPLGFGRAWAQVAEHAVAAAGCPGATDFPTVSNQRDMKRAPYARGNRILHASRPAFAPWPGGCKAKARHRTPNMRVYRTRISPKRVEHYTARGLASHSRQARQIRLGLVIGECAEPVKVELALARGHLLQNRLDVPRLGGRQASVLNQVLESLRRGFHHGAPVRHLAPECPVGS